MQKLLLVFLLSATASAGPLYELECKQGGNLHQTRALRSAVSSQPKVLLLLPKWWQPGSWDDFLRDGTWRRVPPPETEPADDREPSFFRFFDGIQMNIPNDQSLPVVITVRRDHESFSGPVNRECLDFLFTDVNRLIAEGNIKLALTRCPELRPMVELLERRGVNLESELALWRARHQNSSLAPSTEELCTKSTPEALQKVRCTSEPFYLAAVLRSAQTSVELKIEALHNARTPPELVAQYFFDPGVPELMLVASENKFVDESWARAWLTVWGGYADQYGDPLLEKLMDHPAFPADVLEQLKTSPDTSVRLKASMVLNHAELEKLKAADTGDDQTQ